MKIGFQALREFIQYYNLCSTAEATTLVAFNGGLILCVWKPLFRFYHPSKTALFLVDWCGRPASDHCPHYICWTSLTSPDSRSFRPSGGPWGIHFLNWWIVLGKAANGWGHSQNYWSKKILVLRSVIPRYGFSMMVNCGYTMPSKYSMKFLGVHLGTYYIGRVGWQGVVLSIQPHKPTCILWFFSKHIPQIHTRTHSKKIPWENVQKTR